MTFFTRAHSGAVLAVSLSTALLLAATTLTAAADAPRPCADPAPARTEQAPRAISLAGFPNASTTGARGALRVLEGDRHVRRDGTVIENVEIRGSLLIDADDVTVRNVRIVSDGYWPLRVNSGTGTRLIRSTIIGSPDSQASVAGRFRGYRLDLSGAGDGVRMSGGVLRDSYIHDLADFDGAHNDGVDATSGAVKIVHNTILVKMGQTAAIMLSDYGSDPDTDVLVKNNLIGGGGYSFYGGAPDTAQGHEIVGNHFTTRFFRRGGSHGPVAYWRKAGNVWQDNRWADGPRAGRLVRP